MRLRRIRFSLRWLIFAVAITALPLAVLARVHHFAALSKQHTNLWWESRGREQDLIIEQAFKNSGGKIKFICGVGLMDESKEEEPTDEEIAKKIEATYGAKSEIYYLHRLAHYHLNLANK